MTLILIIVILNHPKITKFFIFKILNKYLKTKMIKNLKSIKYQSLKIKLIKISIFINKKKLQLL